MYIKGITKGDTIFFKIQVHENITGWKIRAELYDCSNSIKLANTASGGSDSQILVDDVAEGIFTVIIPKNETDCFDKQSHLEIEIEDNHADQFTIMNGEDTVVNLKCQRIKWSTPSE